MMTQKNWLHLISTVGNFTIGLLTLIVLVLVSWNPLQTALAGAIAWIVPPASQAAHMLFRVAPFIAVASLSYTVFTIVRLARRELDAVQRVQEATVDAVLRVQSTVATLGENVTEHMPSQMIHGILLRQLRVDAKIDSVFITWVRWCSSTWA